MAVSDVVLDAFRRAAEVLEKLGVQFAVFGGLAANIWERIRVTRDADLLVAADSANTTQLKEAMRDAGFAHHEVANHIRLEDIGVFRFWYPAGETGFSIRVDIALGRSEFHRQVFQRRVRVRAFGHEYPVVSLEDCILLKLRAARPIDLADADELLTIHSARIDFSYLRKWAAKLDVADRLQEVLSRQRS